MSWFGGGSKKEESQGEKGFSDAPMDMQQHSSGPNLMAGGGGGNGVAEFQQFSAALQQQMLVQQVITDLNHKAFLKCVEKSRDSTLTGKEVACIHASTNKWLDSNELMMGRLAKKQQQASGGGQFS
jgi:hypothetical protein